VPDKTNTPPVVDPDAVLFFAVTLQCFQTVPRRSHQITQLVRRIKLSKFSKRYRSISLKRLTDSRL
jgi:hypothetical protein